MSKLFSKLSVKLVALFAVVVIVMSAILGYIMYAGITASFEQSMRNELILHAKSAALLIDGDAHETLVQESDMEKPVYKELKEKLQKLLNELEVTYIYTLRKQDDHLIFVVDASEEDPAPIGYEYEMLAAMEETFKGAASADEEMYTDEWGTFLSAYAPITNSSGEIVAIVGVDIDASSILNMRKNIAIQFVSIFGAFAVIIILLTFFIARSITRPIKEVTSKMVETSNRGGDLTQRLNIRSKDEIGSLSMAFNKLFESLHEMMKKVKETTTYLTVSSEELSAATEESTKTITQIAEETSSLAEGIDDVGALFTRMKGEVETFSSNSQQIASNSEEMDLSAQQMKDTVEEAARAVDTSFSSVNVFAGLAENSQEGIKELSQHTQAIVSIVDTISGIAKQTNLLALNAMIEAQRAGEAGRGFIVVAENIRALSDNTQKSVDEVRSLIQTVVQNIEHLVEEQQTTAPMLQKTIVESSKTSTLLNDVFNQFNRIVEMISRISDANESQSAGIENLVKLMDEVYRHFTKQMEVVHSTTAATEEVNATSQEIAASSSKLSDLAEELNGLIKNFEL